MDPRLESRINDIPNAKSEDLAAYVVLYRTLGLEKKLAIECMKELCKRRDNGEDFDYEKFIDDEIAKIPTVSNTAMISRVMSDIDLGLKDFVKKVKK